MGRHATGRLSEPYDYGLIKGFDTVDFVADMREFNVTPHVAQNTTNPVRVVFLKEAAKAAKIPLRVCPNSQPHLMVARRATVDTDICVTIWWKSVDARDVHFLPAPALGQLSAAGHQ